MADKKNGKSLRMRDLSGVTVSDIFNIDPRNIEIEDGHNPRDFTSSENTKAMESLKDSIRAMGVRVPIIVRQDGKKMFLVDGERRLRAVLELIKAGVEIKSIRAIQNNIGDGAERLAVAMTANTGKPFSELELGTGYRKLINYGWTAKQISEKMGVSLRSVTIALELAEAPKEVTQMVKDGEITAALAIEHVRENGSAAVASLRQAADKAQANGHLTARRERTTPTQDATLRKLVKGVFGSLTPDEIEILKEQANKFTDVSLETKPLYELAVYLGLVTVE